jgi:hypothetical protein
MMAICYDDQRSLNVAVCEVSVTKKYASCVHTLHMNDDDETKVPQLGSPVKHVTHDDRQVKIMIQPHHYHWFITKRRRKDHVVTHLTGSLWR